MNYFIMIPTFSKNVCPTIFLIIPFDRFCTVIIHLHYSFEEVFLQLPDDLTDRKILRDAPAREHGEALEDKLVLVVLDHRRHADQEVRRRRDCHSRKYKIAQTAMD